MFHRIASAACAAVGLLALHVLAGSTADTGRRAVWLLLLLLLWAAGRSFFARNDRRLRGIFGTLGAAFVAAFALNLRLETAGCTGWDGLFLSALASFCLSPAAGEGFIRLYEWLSAPKKPMGMSSAKAFWIAFGVLMFCWLPVLIAFFPGITGYDIDGQAAQIYSGHYSTHHPLLHTLFLQLFMELGKWLMNDYSIGYGLYTIAQYVLLAASMAYALGWLSRIRCARVLWIGTLVFFALSPQHMIMASTGTKDVLFAAVMLVLAVELIRFMTENGRMQKIQAWFGCVFLTAAACMLRNNMAYGLALLIPLCVLVWRRQLGVRVLAVLLAGMVAGMAGAAGLKAVTGASEGSIREMLCVPCQQLARVHDLYGLDHPVGYEAREVMPYVDDYTPERADAVKRAAEVDAPERLWRFLKLWVREAFHYPIEYIDAFLYNTKAYWAMDDVSFATTYDSPPDIKRGCMVLWHNPATQLEMQDLWPAVKQVCDVLFSQNGYQRFPVLWQLIHPAFYTWLLCFVLAGAAYRRIKSVLLAGGVMAVYLLTLFLGPCALIRYSYYLMLAVPVMFGALFSMNLYKEEYHV